MFAFYFPYLAELKYPMTISNRAEYKTIRGSRDNAWIKTQLPIHTTIAAPKQY